MEKLLPYQVEHTKNVVRSLSQHNRCLDGSDTGTGKTYSSIAACIEMNKKPFVVCPKSVISSWFNVLDYFEWESYGVTNYESLQNCKMFLKNGKHKVVCPYIKRVEIESHEKNKDKVNNKNDTKTQPKKKNVPKRTKKISKNYETDDSNETKTGHTFNWSGFPEDIVVIFDESHRCKNPRTSNHALLYTLSKHNVKILILSATASDKPENFALPGYVLGLYNNIRDASNWMLKVNANHKNLMSGVHEAIYPEHASRMRIRDLGKLFPDNQITANCYDMDCAKEIQEQYNLIKVEVERLQNAEELSQSYLAAILYARMKIEQLKIPTFIEEAKKYRDEGNSVAIFVNFTNTLRAIKDELGTNCIIYGQQTLEERNKAIQDFNEDKEHIICVNIRSGGVGISLHDLNGFYPRVSIVSPSWSAVDVLQALGRVHRANGKTHVRQRIVFCKDTVEEDVCQRMKDKIANIALLNDGDLLSYNIQGLTDDIYEIGLDDKSNLTEIEKMFLKMDVLNIKKQRLLLELKETEIEIRLLRTTIQNSY